MKFALAVVVVLAAVMGVQSSLVAGIPGIGLGLGINGLGINGIGINGLGINGLGINTLGINGLGLGLGVPGIGLGLGVPGIVGPGWLGAPGAIKIASAPLLAAQIPAAVNIASGPIGGIAVAKQATLAGPIGATYVAKTLGAIHTAPLAGHIQSVASINGAPAPGTW